MMEEPSMSLHRPASATSQDISHVLASVFKDVYAKDIGKDTVSNLMKTRKGGSSYHERYVAELQQARSEYSRCVKEADVQESHIIQARAQAAASQSLAYERLKENMGEYREYLSLVTVKPAFSMYVDTELLERSDLISPTDVLIRRKPQVKAPALRKPNPANPTVAYTMLVSREPQDDGYTRVPSPEKIPHDINELDLSLTFGSSSDTSVKTQRKINTRPKWKDEPSATDRAEGWDELQKLKDRDGFLCNPRFLPPISQQGGTSLIRARTRVEKTEEQSSADEPTPVFVAYPSVVLFTEYSAGHVFETTLELKNLTSASRNVRVIPPTTPYFSIGLGRFPGEGDVVAPGLSCKYTVRFAPDSLGPYEDFIVVQTQVEHPLVVPILARRPPPVLTLPRVLDCGYCLVGGAKFIKFLCQNVGLSAGSFCIIPKSQWPASNLRSVARSHFCEQQPFAVSPSLFVLQPGEATAMEVAFFPTAAERSCQVFTVVCDNCQVKEISVEGEGQLIAVELVSVSGRKQRGLAAERAVRFSPCNPHSVQEKTLVIRNNSHVELPFHWQIMNPNLRPPFSGETPEPSHIQFHLATGDAFHISPRSGALAPCQEEEFLLTFCPKKMEDYHSVCQLVLQDDPQFPQGSCDNGVQPVRPDSKLSNIIIMEIEVKGSTEPYQVLLEPYAVIIPGEIFIRTTTRRRFKMWNHSKTCISFQWERMSSGHIIEVEPPAGIIEENECFDFDLIVTGGKPEKVVTSLLCHIEHHREPVTLVVEVAFKGPTVTVGVPSLDFGLVKLGEQMQTTLLLTNVTQLEASWTLEERRDDQSTQIFVEPHRGVLPPLASISVDVTFTPRFCQQYETELELTVEDGTGCHLSVRADVQHPQVCLISSQLLLSELYVGVPAKPTVTLFNQTLLPAHFSWMAELQGKHAELCTASFEPSSGTLGPNISMEITVNFISHTDLPLTEVAALCEVQGMKSPLLLSIMVSKTRNLSVSYSLPSVCSTGDDDNPSPLLLDFGDDVILNRAVTRQLLITNQTAIPAPFTIEVEYFTCPKPDDQSEKSVSYVRKPLHSVQAEKVKEKAQKDFVSGLLAHGKGAAFFVWPDSGMLGPFETQTVDVTAHTEMWGEYRDHLICKAGDLDAALVPMQMTVKGCPLYFQTTGRRPDGPQQGTSIKFGAHVSGGDTVSRSLRINNPTMFDIRVDWETYNVDLNDHKLGDAEVAYGDASPVKDADDHEEMSGALTISDGSVQTDRQRNETPGSDGTSSPLQTDGEENTPEDQESPLHPLSAEKKLDSDHIRPHMGNLSDFPYCITPQQIVIPAKSSATIHVSFTPLTLSGSLCESRCVCLALGFMSLDSEMAACVAGKVERAQGLDLEPVRVDLQAAVKQAALLVQMEENGGELEFHASAADLLQGDSQKELAGRGFDVTQSVGLKNTSEMPLQFRLGTQPPFLVLRPQPRARTSNSSSPSTGDSQSVVLQPQHSVQVKVAFRCSLSLLDHADQSDEEVPPGVTLVQSAGGQKKLMFRQNLLIHYSNNNQQTLPLCAHLDLATMHLSSDSINFGFCHVGQTQTKEVTLHNQGANTSWTSFIDSDDGDVFRVSPDAGPLRSKELHIGSSSERLQISFTPSVGGEFRAAVVIRSPLVKTPLTLQLQGTGSNEDSHKSS